MALGPLQGPERDGHGAAVIVRGCGAADVVMVDVVVLLLGTAACCDGSVAFLDVDIDEVCLRRVRQIVNGF